MLVPVVAAIAGATLGWALATGTVWAAVAGLALAALAVVVGLDRRAARSTLTTDRATSGWQDLDRELERARRYGRPVSVVRVSAADDAGSSTSKPTALPRLRRLDRAWAEHGEVIAVLPETDRHAAEGLLARLQARSEASSAVGLASFPDDGATRHALLTTLFGVPAGMSDRADAGAAVEPPSNVIAMRPDRNADAALTDRRESSV
jgi:hypothetical protein